MKYILDCTLVLQQCSYIGSLYNQPLLCTRPESASLTDSKLTKYLRVCLCCGSESSKCRGGWFIMGLRKAESPSTGTECEIYQMNVFIFFSFLCFIWLIGSSMPPRWKARMKIKEQTQIRTAWSRRSVQEMINLDSRRPENCSHFLFLLLYMPWNTLAGKKLYDSVHDMSRCNADLLKYS